MWIWGATKNEVRDDGVWLAAPNGSITIQKSLALLLTSEKILPPADRKKLFGILYFLTEASREAISWPQRLRWLRSRFKNLADDSLADYFLYSATQALSSIENMPTAIAAIAEFSGCEVMGIAPVLAQASVQALLRLRGGAVGVLPDVLKLAEHFEDVGSKHGPDARWRREQFHEWFFFSYCEDLLDVARIEAYELLSGAGWYERHPKTIAAPVSLAMRREVNLAFGHWYRTRASTHEKAAYVELVAMLADSPDIDEMETAFFLIRHSVVIGPHPSSAVDEVFLPQVRKIARDARLSWIHHAFPDFFEANTSDSEDIRGRQSRD
jgi:hypothetical protein